MQIIPASSAKPFNAHRRQVRGVHFGRAKRLSSQDVQELHRLRALGVPVAELTQQYGLTRASIYRYLAEQPVGARAEVA